MIKLNFKRVRAIAKKEFFQIKRDPRSIALAFAIPILLLLMFGFALSLDVDNVPMGIWNQDNSQFSKDFILNFRNSRYFQIVAYSDKYPDLMHLMDQNKILMLMVIPKDFTKFISSDQTAPVQILVDGSDSNTAGIAMGYLNSIISRYNIKLIAKALNKSSLAEPLPIKFKPRTWFNPNRESTDFIIPGLIAIIIMIITALLTALTVAREWERGTMEQLISTPVSSEELIMGKFIPYFVIGFIDLLVAIAMSKFVFWIPLEGNVLLLVVLSSLFITGALAMGIFFSIVGKTQLAASQLAIMATFMPTYMLSGFVYPIYNMPKAIQLVTCLIPARYYIVILRGIYSKGIGVKPLALPILFLSLFTIAMIILANYSFKKKIT